MWLYWGDGGRNRTREVIEGWQEGSGVEPRQVENDGRAVEMG